MSNTLILFTFFICSDVAFGLRYQPKMSRAMQEAPEAAKVSVQDIAAEARATPQRARLIFEKL